MPICPVCEEETISFSYSEGSGREFEQACGCELTSHEITTLEAAELQKRQIECHEVKHSSHCQIHPDQRAATWLAFHLHSGMHFSMFLCAACRDATLAALQRPEIVPSL